MGIREHWKLGYYIFGCDDQKTNLISIYDIYRLEQIKKCPNCAEISPLLRLILKPYLYEPEEKDGKV